jgi:hypothetical protein
MRLYGAIEKVEPQDDGTVRVHGIATSETVDDQGEIITADAIRAALPDYMRFPALREMHQLSAAGTTLEAEVGDDGTTRVVAHVVDPVAVAKVKNQVYRGFSIGGRVTRRDAGNPKDITGLILSEISLVDRPANPEAVFDCWKAAAISGGPYCEVDAEHALSAPAGAASEPFNPPVQIWACGVAGHHHRAKSEAMKCLEMRSLGAADPSMRPQLEANLECAPLTEQEAVETDAAISEMGVYSTLDSPSGDETAFGSTITGNLREAGRVAGIIQELDWLRGAIDAEAAIAAGESQTMAQMRGNVCELLDFLNALVAEEVSETPSAAQTDDDALPSASALVARVMGARSATPVTERPQTESQNIHNPASRLLIRAGRRHTGDTMEELGSAHRDLVAAGAQCHRGVKGAADDQSRVSELQAGTPVADLAKMLVDERAEKAALVRVFDEMMPMLDRLSKRIDDIAGTPLPPLTIARNSVSISKQQDSGGTADIQLSPEAIASALSKMTKEDQTLTLIKASYAKPIRVHATTSGEP